MPKRVSHETHMKQKARYYAKSRVGAFNSGRSWGIMDTALVIKHAMPDSELAKKLGRSVQAIQMCRIRETSNV